MKGTKQPHANGNGAPPYGTPNVAAAAGGAGKRKRRKRLPLLLLAGAFVVAIVLVAANVLRAGTTFTVQITNQSTAQVDLNQSLALSPYLFGSNVFPQTGTTGKDPTGQGLMNYGPQVVQGLRSGGVKLLRFPGGKWGEAHTLSKEQLNAFSNLLNQMNADGFMQVQLADPLDVTPVPLATRATRAALLVDYMNNKGSIQRAGTNAPFHPVKFWSVGNEPDTLINPDTRQKYTVAQYTQAFITYSLAMHQKDPSIKVFGPEISQYSAQGGPKDSAGALWMAGFLNGIGTYEHTHSLSFKLLDGVSFHLYPFGKTASDLLNNTRQWSTLVPSLHQLIQQALGEDLPIALTEVNSDSGASIPAQSLAALWWAQTLGALMSNRVDYVAFFSTEGVDVPYPFFLQRGLTETALLRTMQLFAHLQSNLVPIQGGQGPVGVYATQDDGHATASLIFINTTAASQRITLTASGALPFGINLGQTFNPWQNATVTIQPDSMLVLTLHRGGGNEVFSFSNLESTQQAAPDVQHVVCSNTTNSAVVC